MRVIPVRKMQNFREPISRSERLEKLAKMINPNTSSPVDANVHVPVTNL